MGKIYSVVNKKGGVGKSSTVSALSSICSAKGKKVLVVDLDPQANSTSLFFRDTAQKTITDVFKCEKENLSKEFMYSVIQRTQYANIDIIPGDINLDEESDIILLQNASTDGKKVFIPRCAKELLVNAFEMIRNDYDYIFIDNTPYFNIISKNALSASDGVLIPVQAEGFSYDGLSILLEKIYEIKGEMNNKLNIIGVFFTDVTKRTNLYKIMNEQFRTQLNDTLLETFIRSDNKVAESNSVGVPLGFYAPKSNAVTDYIDLATELKLI